MKLEVKRVVKASRSKVFAAWTNPELMRQWFGGGVSTVREVSAEAHAGGAWRIHSEGGSCDSGAGSTVHGTYRDVVPNERLAFTWIHDSFGPHETLVTVSLRDVAGGTEITILHDGFLDDPAVTRHTTGWTACLDGLTTLLQAVPA